MVVPTGWKLEDPNDLTVEFCVLRTRTRPEFLSHTTKTWESLDGPRNMCQPVMPLAETSPVLRSNQECGIKMNKDRVNARLEVVLHEGGQCLRGRNNVLYPKRSRHFEMFSIHPPGRVAIPMRVAVRGLCRS